MLSSRTLKLILHTVLRLLYRYEVKGREHASIIQPGATVLVVVNHISFLDGALLMAAMDQLPAFAVNTGMANRWWLKPFRRVANIFPLDPTNPMAIKELIGKINAGQPCVIFPEGRLSVTGALMKIYAGPAYIADRTGATIVPVRLEGPELTRFTRLKAGQVTPHWFPKITITICPPRKLAVAPDLRGKARCGIVSVPNGLRFKTGVAVAQSSANLIDLSGIIDNAVSDRLTIDGTAVTTAGKIAKPRMVVPSHFGMVCIPETPEGATASPDPSSAADPGAAAPTGRSLLIGATAIFMLHAFACMWIRNLGFDHISDDDFSRVTIAQGFAHEIGSVEVGKFADLVLWSDRKSVV